MVMGAGGGGAFSPSWEENGAEVSWRVCVGGFC